MDMVQEELNLKLREAAKMGELAEVRKLVASGAKVDAGDDFSLQPLHYAARKGHLPVVRYLLSKGAKVDAADIHGRQALHYVAGQGYLPVAKFLIRKGAKVDAVDKFGITPLHLGAAWSFGHLDMVAFLLENGADPASERDNGETPMDCARDYPKVHDLMKKWDGERRQEANAKAIRDHWKKVGKYVAAGPGM